MESYVSYYLYKRIGQWLWHEKTLKQKNDVEAAMFKDPYMIYMIAKQKHEMLLAEIEKKQRYQSSMVPIVKKRLLDRIMLKIARMFIGIGISMERRWGNYPEGVEDICGETTPQAASDPDA